MIQQQLAKEKNNIKQFRTVHPSMTLSHKNERGQCCTDDDNDAYQQASQLNNTGSKDRRIEDEALGRMSVADDGVCFRNQRMDGSIDASIHEHERSFNWDG